jgi:aminoglycoside phosphotransferase family enzyme
MLPTPPSLERKVAALCRAEAYADAPRRVEVVETHMSFVFLAATQAYKMKKPVRYDFGTLALRRHYCEEELRLNARLAPGIYLAVVPLRQRPDGSLQLDRDGEIVEWLVQMQRLPQSEMLDERIRKGRLAAAEIDTLADRLAAFYARAPTESLTLAEHGAHIAAEIERDHAAFAAHPEALDPAAVAALRGAHLAFLRREAELLRDRVERRRLVEGHGDLRPEHVCLLPLPVVFDSIEFSRRLRIVDPVAELAFLAMECELLGAETIGPRLLSRYAVRTGDQPPAALVDYYKSRSASVRARLALLHTRELERAHWGRWLAAGRRYFDVARRYASPG